MRYRLVGLVQVEKLRPQACLRDRVAGAKFDRPPEGGERPGIVESGLARLSQIGPRFREVRAERDRLSQFGGGTGSVAAQGVNLRAKVMRVCRIGLLAE